jgi:hypothetical protein
MSEAIEFKLSRDKADFFPATLAMMLRTRVGLIVLLAFISVLATAYICILFRDSASVGLIGVATFVGMVLYCALAWLGVCYFAARRGWSAPGALSETRYVFSDAGIAGESADIQSNTKWDYWKWVFTTSRFLIIISASGQWMFFPKRTFGTMTLAELEQLARAKLSRRTKAS